MKTYSMPCPIFEIGIDDEISSVVDAIATEHDDGSVSISFAHPPQGTRMAGHIRNVDSLAEAKAQADAAREYLARMPRYGIALFEEGTEGNDTLGAPPGDSLRRLSHRCRAGRTHRKPLD